MGSSNATFVSYYNYTYYYTENVLIINCFLRIIFLKRLTRFVIVFLKIDFYNVLYSLENGRITI